MFSSHTACTYGLLSSSPRMNYLACLILAILEVSRGTPIELNAVSNYVIKNIENLREFERVCGKLIKDDIFFSFVSYRFGRISLLYQILVSVRKHDVS